MSHFAASNKFTAPSIIFIPINPAIRSQPTITNRIFKMRARAILHIVTFIIFICIIILAAAAVAVCILELPFVLEANKNIVQHDAHSNPPLRSKMVVRRDDLDGDGVQRSQPTLQNGVNMLNAASSLALRIIKFLQKSQRNKSNEAVAVVPYCAQVCQRFPYMEEHNTFGEKIHNPRK
jgi:hypothetical protein